jgi:hypothetical protein
VAVLIGVAELERLERMRGAVRRLALALGQTESILEKVERKELHPAMAAFGLWRDEDDLAALADEISAKRHQPSARPDLDL